MVFRKLPQKCWEVLGLLLRFHCGTITLAAVLIGFLRPLRFAVGTLTAVTRMPQNPFSWMEMLGLCSCVCFFFFFSWVVFVGSVFEIFIENQRPRFFHRLGMKTLIFRLGMPPEWRHGDDSNTWEFWDITQGDLKHCLQYAGQSRCLGSRHVIIRTSGFYAFMLVEIPWEPFLSISWTGVVLLGLGTSQRRNVGMFWLMTPQLSNVLVFLLPTVSETAEDVLLSLHRELLFNVFGSVFSQCFCWFGFTLIASLAGHEQCGSGHGEVSDDSQFTETWPREYPLKNGWISWHDFCFNKSPLAVSL